MRSQKVLVFVQTLKQVIWKRVMFFSSCFEVSLEYVSISLYYRVKLDPLLRRHLSEDPVKCLLCYIVSVLWLMGMLPVFIPVGFLCGSLLRLSRLLFHWFRCSKLACEWPSEMITSKMFTFGPVEVIFLPFMHAFVKGNSFFLAQ